MAPSAARILVLKFLRGLRGDVGRVYIVHRSLGSLKAVKAVSEKMSFSTLNESSALGY